MVIYFFVMIGFVRIVIIYRFWREVDVVAVIGEGFFLFV